MTVSEAQPAIQPIPEHAKAVFKGQIFTVWQWEQELYDGSFATYERLTRADYVYAVGVLPNQNILLIEDTQPNRDPILTPAGGKVDPGETPEQAVQREFLEETGHTIGELIPWHSYTPTSKIQMQIHGFIARDITKTHKPTPEAGEKIEIITYTFEEFLQLGENPMLRDWLLRIKLLEAQLKPDKKEELRKLLYE